MSKLSLRRKSESVLIETEEGTDVNMELREMSASERDSYLESLTKRVRFDPAGRPGGVKDFTGIHADLLTRCLFRENQSVPHGEIQGWPASVTSELYAMAQKLNGLDKDTKGLEPDSKNG